MAATEPQARRWCFTVFEANLKEHGTLAEWTTWAKVQQLNGVRYMVFQLEQARTERLHVQGYVHFTVQKRRGSVNNILHLQNLHLEMAKGTPSDNRAYCTDNDKRVDGTEAFEFGDCPGGQGSKLAVVAATIKEKGLKRAIEESPATYITNGRGMRDLDRFYKRQKTRPDSVHVIVIHGDSGAGKSWWAKKLYDPGNTYTMPAVPRNGNAWFDGYDSERTLVLDEFSGRIEFELFKNMCDPLDMQVPVKGDYTPAMWDTIIVTTNNHPCTWYGNDIDSWGVDPNVKSPIQRRIGTYIEAKGIYNNDTQKYNVISWVADIESGPVDSLPTRADEQTPVDAEVAPSNPVVDEDMDALLEEWEKEEKENNFMPDSFVATDTDFEGLLGGLDGDEEPEGLNLFPGFDVQ